MVVLFFSPFRELVCSGLALYTEIMPDTSAFFGHIFVPHCMNSILTNVLGPKVETRNRVHPVFQVNQLWFRRSGLHRGKSEATGEITDGWSGELRKEVRSQS